MAKNRGGYDRFKKEEPPVSDGLPSAEVVDPDLTDDKLEESADLAKVVAEEEARLEEEAKPLCSICGAKAYSTPDGWQCSAYSNHSKKGSETKARTDASEAQATLANGTQSPPFEVREGADPLLLKCFKLFERIQTGGLMPPWSSAYNEMADLILELKDNLRVE